MTKHIQVFNILGLLMMSVVNGALAADGFSGYYGPTSTKNSVPTRDPFSNSDKMYNEVGIQTMQKANQANYNYKPGVNFSSGSGVVAMPTELPKMRLKGLVSKANQKPAALLEIEGAGVYYVTAGEELGLAQGGILKIMSINETGVKVQVPQMNQQIVVR